MIWELDVWGRLADMTAAGELDLAALEFDYRAARNFLAAQAIQLWIDIRLSLWLRCRESKCA